MRKITKTLTVFLLSAMLISPGMIPRSTWAAEETGASTQKCGENLYWSLKNGTLTISGSGDMDNWREAPVEDDNGYRPEPSLAPWHDHMDEITSLVVMEGVTSLGEECLREAYNLSSVTLPSSLKKIGDYAFMASGISSIEIPDSVTEVGTGAFMICDNLEHITFSRNMTEISEGLFSNCMSLTSIDLPEGITKIGSSAFANCYSLRSVTIPDHVTQIGSGAFFCDMNLTELAIPSALTSIEEYTFAGTGLTELVIPAKVTIIGKYAIADSAIERVTVPDSVNEIKSYGLCNPNTLKEVRFEGHAPAKMWAFLFKDNVMTAYYPAHDTSWTSSKKNQYSGTVTWTAWECREGHSYEDAVTLPTFASQGQITHTCKVCGASQTETLDALSPQVSFQATKGSGNYKIKMSGQLVNYQAGADYSAIVEHGILYITSTKLGAKTLTTTTSGRTKVSFSAYNSEGGFSYTISASSATSKYVARAYTIYQDESGKKLTYYSPAVSVSYNTCK